MTLAVDRFAVRSPTVQAGRLDKPRAAPLSKFRSGEQPANELAMLARISESHRTIGEFGRRSVGSWCWVIRGMVRERFGDGVRQVRHQERQAVTTNQRSETQPTLLPSAAPLPRTRAEGNSASLGTMHATQKIVTVHKTDNANEPPRRSVRQPASSCNPCSAPAGESDLRNFAGRARFANGDRSRLAPRDESR